MRTRRCFLLGAASAALPACRRAKRDQPPAGAIRVRDFRGKEIHLVRPARRIVCLIESALSGLYMLGAGERVVGVSTNVYESSVHAWYARLDRRLERRELPTPGNWDFVSLESVIALKPDLVILWAQQSESIVALEERGIPVFGVFLGSLEDVYREVESLGILTGTSKRAGELVAYTRGEVEALVGRLSEAGPADRPRVYYMWSQGNLETSGGTSTVNELIALAGGRNVFEHIVQEHMVVNLETLIAADPEVVILWHNERKSPEDVLRDPQWATIRAVRNKKVYEFPEVFLCDLWTLKFQYAVKTAAAWIHPERFGAVDLEQEKRRMLNTLYGPAMEWN